jgi:hypothetical protein
MKANSKIQFKLNDFKADIILKHVSFLSGLLVLSFKTLFEIKINTFHIDFVSSTVYKCTLFLLGNKFQKQKIFNSNINEML